MSFAAILSSLLSGLVMSLVTSLFAPPPIPDYHIPAPARYLPGVRKTVDAVIVEHYFLGTADGIGYGIPIGMVLVVFLWAIWRLVRNFLNNLLATIARSIKDALTPRRETSLIVEQPDLAPAELDPPSPLDPTP